jgi:hypothetical protein
LEEEGWKAEECSGAFLKWRCTPVVVKNGGEGVWWGWGVGEGVVVVIC